MAGETRFEHATYGFGDRYSTVEPLPCVSKCHYIIKKRFCQLFSAVSGGIFRNFYENFFCPPHREQDHEKTSYLIYGRRLFGESRNRRLCGHTHLRGRRREYSGGELSTTNNRMEVQAVIVGLERLKYPCAVDVYSDSAYTVNAFANRWIYAWKRNGWKKADGKAVQNVDLWERLYALTQTHEVTFHKVAGHADDELNNRCDELARAAISLLRESLSGQEGEIGEA